MILEPLSDFEDLPQRRLMWRGYCLPSGTENGAMRERALCQNCEPVRTTMPAGYPQRGRATASAASLHRAERHAAGRVPLNVFT